MLLHNDFEKKWGRRMAGFKLAIQQDTLETQKLYHNRKIHIKIDGGNSRMSIADRMSQLCGVLVRCLRTVEPVTVSEPLV